MRRESDQAARALTEQARGLKDMTTATQNTAAQIKLITHANREHSTVAGRVLDQLRDIRKITDRNARDVNETRGNTAELLRHADGSRRPRRRRTERHQRQAQRSQRARMTSPRRIGILTTDTALVVTSWDAALAAMTGVDSAHGDRPSARRRGPRSGGARAAPGDQGTARVGRRAGPRAGAARSLSSRVLLPRRRRASTACSSAW